MLSLLNIVINILATLLRLAELLLPKPLPGVFLAPGHMGVGNMGTGHMGTGHMGTWKYGYQDIWVPGHMGTGIYGYKDI